MFDIMGDCHTSECTKWRGVGLCRVEVWNGSLCFASWQDEQKRFLLMESSIGRLKYFTNIWVIEIWGWPSLRCQIEAKFLTPRKVVSWLVLYLRFFQAGLGRGHSYSFLVVGSSLCQFPWQRNNQSLVRNSKSCPCKIYVWKASW